MSMSFSCPAMELSQRSGEALTGLLTEKPGRFGSRGPGMAPKIGARQKVAEMPSPNKRGCLGFPRWFRAAGVMSV